MQTSKLMETITPLLHREQPHYESALRVVAETFGAVSGTLHRTQGSEPLLHMVAALGLPQSLLAVTSKIPFGKGIAGLCAERGEAVTLCNLQTDESGQARPQAKQTGVAGAIAVPIFDHDGQVAGVLGIGKASEHVYTADEQRVLAACAQLFGRALTS